MQSLHPADAAVLLGYVAVVLGLGWWAQRRQADQTDFFLGGRRLPWPLVGVSILATAFSATSLLGGPGEAISFGLLWLQLQLGDLLAILIVVTVFVPALRGRALTTAYEFLEERFDRRVRVLASVLFQLQVVLRAGVLVYGPALALSTLTGLSLPVTIVAVGALATLYTVSGGLEAVVWTDALQLGVVAVGLGACLWTVAATLDGGLGAAFAAAAADGKTDVVDFDQPLTSPRSLPGAVVGYGILALAVAGTNPQSVQRYLACRSVGEARRAALLGWAVGAAVTVATLVVGLALYGFYRSTAHTLPADLPADAVLPHFVGNELAPGVAGLLVAAILAAAMSSLDSALSSLATATEVDLIGRDGDRARDLRRARLVTLGWGVVATLAALALAGRGTLLALGVRVMGWFAGPVLALFVMALMRRSPSARSALAGAVTGFAVTVVLVADPFGAPILSPGIWTTAIGAITTLLATALLETTVGSPRRVPADTTTLAPGSRREDPRDD